jgi:UDP-N-acetylmuramoyl-tripeptide--D-alanyl-D-alanine ligase
MRESSWKRHVCETVLRWMARSVLWRQKPHVIGITGSIGKTTTKDMIVHVLRRHKKVWYTHKNYNNEIGVCLTICGVEHGMDSALNVLQVFLRWIYALCTVHYPDIIVVEMGVDRMHDMDKLLHIVSPDIAVLTAIAPAHSEFFPSIEHIAEEKQKIVTKMKEGGVAIINADDRNVANVCATTKNRCLSYGTVQDANFVATDIDVCFQQCYTTGLSFKLNYEGKVIPVRLHNLCAEHMIYATLATLAVAHELHLNIIEVINDLEDFVPSPGRMRLLKARRGALVIDDTYNASPKAMKAAIETLGKIPAKRKIAVVGDMRELGDISVAEHKKVAIYMEENKIDEVFFVGEKMRDVYEQLQQKCIQKKYFGDAKEAVQTIVDHIEQGDVILVKGSRGMHMEKIVRAIVDDPTQTL